MLVYISYLDNNQKRAQVLSSFIIHSFLSEQPYLMVKYFLLMNVFLSVMHESGMKSCENLKRAELDWVWLSNPDQGHPHDLEMLSYTLQNLK